MSANCSHAKRYLYNNSKVPGNIECRNHDKYHDTYIENEILKEIFMVVIPGIAGFIIFGICVFVMSLGISLWWKDFYIFKVKPRLEKKQPDDKSEGDTLQPSAKTSNATIFNGIPEREPDLTNPEKTSSATSIAIRINSERFHGSHHSNDLYEMGRKPSKTIHYPSAEAIAPGSIITIKFPRYDEKEAKDQPLISPEKTDDLENTEFGDVIQTKEDDRKVI